MSNATPPARRESVERNIYRRTSAVGRVVFEVGFKDGAGMQRWRTVEGGITAARALRDELLARRGRGERVAPNVRLRFGEAADRWLQGPVLDLRPSTQAGYRNAVDRHLRPRFATRRLDAIEPDDVARVVRELRGEGKSEATAAVVLGVMGRVYKYAARRLAWAGANPVALLLASERPKVSQAQRRRLFDGEQVTQTIAAAKEPWRTLFTMAALTGARVSELCGLTWADVRIEDLDEAEVEFARQVDRHGNRAPTKTDGSARTIPIPRQLAAGLARHKLAARSCQPEGYVFATSSGRPLSQRNVARALRAAQCRAVDESGRPTFPPLSRARRARTAQAGPAWRRALDALVPAHRGEPGATGRRVSGRGWLSARAPGRQHHACRVHPRGGRRAAARHATVADDRRIWKRAGSRSGPDRPVRHRDAGGHGPRVAAVVVIAPHPAHDRMAREMAGSGKSRLAYGR